jgi:alkylhydroperoxidase family enzyme
VAHLAGTADEIRARVPPVLEAWEFMRDNVLRDGLVDPELKRLAVRYVAEDPEVMDVERFDGRERLALEWAHAIVWDSDAADDELWERLHAEFSEPQLVELGCSIGFALGQQHWERTLGLPPQAGIS